MGTSSSFGGPKGSTPLVPSWLGNDLESSHDDNGQSDVEGDQTSDSENPSQNNDDSQSNDNQTEPGKELENNRYRQVRNNFTRFVKSGGSNKRAFGKAISNYVSKASGGSKTASQRMGSSRVVTSALVSFLQSVQSNGAESTLRSYGLDNLIGHSITDVFLELMDFVCPDGGNLDEGIARNAFVETIAELAENEISNLDTLTLEQIKSIIQIYATHSIEARLCNDIGTKIFIDSQNLSFIDKIQEQLHDFIARGVSDALQKFDTNFADLTNTNTAQLVEEIYTEAFRILQILGDNESN